LYNMCKASYIGCLDISYGINPDTEIGYYAIKGT
jgi:hypothetical protein